MTSFRFLEILIGLALICLFGMPFENKSYKHKSREKNVRAKHIDAYVARRPRWWFGGAASTSVACIVAPIDLIKTHMQTQNVKKNMLQTAQKVYRLRGWIGYYDGFSAAALRQMICTSLRFSIYETGKQNQILDDNLLGKSTLAFFAGIVGATIGVPLDLVNVRMQNDMKRRVEIRHNYKNVLDALIRIPKDEGWAAMYTGVSASMLKSAVGTCGQIAFYDHTKTILASNFELDDDVFLHFQSSLISSVFSSIISQPFDVLKTVIMTARPGEMNSIPEAVRYILRFGPSGVFRGLMPAIMRKGPATVMLFLIYEQLRINWGYLPLDENEELGV